MSRVVSFLHFILPPSFFFPMARCIPNAFTLTKWILMMDHNCSPTKVSITFLFRCPASLLLQIFPPSGGFVPTNGLLQWAFFQIFLSNLPQGKCHHLMPVSNLDMPVPGLWICLQQGWPAAAAGEGWDDYQWPSFWVWGAADCYGLKKKKTNIGYVTLNISCQVKPGDRAHNQAHYEAMGEVKDLADMK